MKYFTYMERYLRARELRSVHVVATVHRGKLHLKILSHLAKVVIVTASLEWLVILTTN